MEKIECLDCKKKFDTEEALNQHRKMKHETNQTEQKPINYKKFIWYGIGVLIILFIGYLIFRPGIRYDPLPYTEHFLGGADAKVTIIEFSDFECPACKFFWSNIEPQLKEEFMDTEKIKFVYKHFPLSQHRYAFKASEASECASDQGKFWEFHDKIFSSDSLDVQNLKKIAKELNLDADKFNNCLDSGVMRSRVEDDFEHGVISKVQATPSFLINGKLMSGAKPFDQFKEIIDKELNFIQ